MLPMLRLALRKSAARDLWTVLDRRTPRGAIPPVPSAGARLIERRDLLEDSAAVHSAATTAESERTAPDHATERVAGFASPPCGPVAPWRMAADLSISATICCWAQTWLQTTALREIRRCGDTWASSGIHQQ